MAREYALDEELLESWQQEVTEEGVRRFPTYEQYEAHYVKLVEDLYEESRTHWKPTKQRWMEADKRLELDRIFETNSWASPTRTDIALVPQAIEKSISQLIENLPRPQISPRQAGQEDMVGALNYMMGEVLDQNSFDLLIARIALDMKRFNIGVIKQTIDESGRGPFGMEGKIVLTKTDPRYVWPDPFAKSWRWEDMEYLLVAEPYDLSEIRSRWAGPGHKVKSESFYSLKREPGQESDDDHQGVLESDSGHRVGERKRAMVKELWLKDRSCVFKPMMDPDGNPVYKSDGEPMGTYEPRYPRGRLIIVANGKLLLDCQNPFLHGQPPYSFYLNRLSPRLFSFGDVELLSRLEDKMNTLHKDCLRNARVNINSPWIVDHGAFESSELYKALTNEEGLVIVKAPNSVVMRQPPAELPQFVFPLLGWMETMFNDLSGVPNIQQGQLEKGAQLSAEAISNLQGSSSSNARIKARLFEMGLEHTGHLMQFNLRDVYDSPKEFEVNDPSTGEPKVLHWRPEVSDGEYAVEVSAGSSMPGAKAGAQQQAMNLYDMGLIDREAALDQMQYPGRGVVVKRINDRITELAKLGVDYDMKGNKTGRAGRKNKLGI